MLGNLFHLDNPIWVFMGRLVDFALLTGLWLLCCIPVVTAGASTKALYMVTMQMVKKEEGYTASSFFHFFRENFMESTLLGLGVLVLAVFLGSDLYVYGKMAGRAGTFLFTVFLILTVFFLMTAAYLYPMRAATCYRGLRLVSASFVAACKNPGWSLLLVFIMVGTIAVGVFVFAPLLVVGIGLAAYVQCKIVLFLLGHYRINCYNFEP